MVSLFILLSIPLNTDDSKIKPSTQHGIVANGGGGGEGCECCNSHYTYLSRHRIFKLNHPLFNRKIKLSFPPTSIDEEFLVEEFLVEEFLVEEFLVEEFLVEEFLVASGKVRFDFI